MLNMSFRLQTGYSPQIVQVHAYERMNRVYNYTLDDCAPVHIIVGDGGNHEKASLPHADEPNQCPKGRNGDDIGGYCGFPFTSGPAAGQYCWDSQPEWSAFRETSFGHGIINVSFDQPERFNFSK
jgi:hypothetical protein